MTASQTLTYSNFHLKLSSENGGFFVPTLTTSEFLSLSSPGPFIPLMQSNDVRMIHPEEVWQGSFVKCMEWLAFIDPEVSTWITPSESREVFRQNLQRMGEFHSWTTMEAFPSREERKNQNALCEGDVNRCATPP